MYAEMPGLWDATGGSLEVCQQLAMHLQQVQLVWLLNR
jgi:hypothetical protein